MTVPAAARRGMLVSLCAVLTLGWQAAGLAERVVTRVEVRPEPRGAVVSVLSSCTEPLEVKAFALRDPPRLVFDLAGAELAAGVPDSFPVGGEGVRQVRLGQFSAEPKVARLVVDLTEGEDPPAHEIRAGREPGETIILVRRGGPLALRPPTVEAVGDAVLVRVAGAARLARKAGMLADPPRVYADLAGAMVPESYRREIEAGLVRELRMGQQASIGDHQVARLVVELREEQAYTVFSDGEDLILAVGRQPWALPLPEYQAGNRLQGKRIVVDPGHGGPDIGAPAVFGPPPQGPFEKDIVLDIGRRLAALLVAEGAEVTMTREDDTYLSLQERAAIANRLQADALVSLHCNSCDVPNMLQGTSVYYDHGHSAGFAQLVQRELVAALGTRDKGVRNANFAVIRRANVPGILVETAYINHEEDRARLIHPNFRERAARAMLQGLIRFLAAEGPSI